MAVSVYSWVLDKIRQGWGQLQSWYAATIRFPGTTRDTIFRGWLTAWAGKYTADLMINNQNTALSDLIQSSLGQPEIAKPDSPSNLIQSWFPYLTDAPYDFNATYKISRGGLSEYGQWRYEALEGDTYLMILERMGDLLVKEYRIRNRSDIDLVNLIIIGTEKP